MNIQDYTVIGCEMTKAEEAEDIENILKVLGVDKEVHLPSWFNKRPTHPLSDDPKYGASFMRLIRTEERWDVSFDCGYRLADSDLKVSPDIFYAILLAIKSYKKGE